MKPSNHVLVDACVARSVSERNSGKLANTHQVLLSLRAGNIGVCMTPELQAEWEKHATRFMTRWLTNMEQRCRVRRERDRRIADLRESIVKFVTQEEKREVILKDVHITEAAIFFQVAVFSFDDTQRRVLSELHVHYERLGGVQWFNPESDGQPSLEWLRGGGHDAKACQIAKFGYKAAC
ncbi:hypothetical protein [Amycolatopsis silviterrae]|uniref:DUF4935 domain-containing protein n=1 Tax=Amycolatopsis silviterrae TaxID=1656914 RepID=A0ABW5GYE8_9PSEU